MDEVFGTHKVAQRLSGPRGGALETAARLAFTDAMNRAALVGAAVALAAALVALLLLPARATRQRPAAPGGALTQASPILPPRRLREPQADTPH